MAKICLTENQLYSLTVLEQFIDENGRLPSVKEFCIKAGFVNDSQACYHAGVLFLKGAFGHKVKDGTRLHNQADPIQLSPNNMPTNKRPVPTNVFYPSMSNVLNCLYNNETARENGLDAKQIATLSGCSKTYAYTIMCEYEDDFANIGISKINGNKAIFPRDDVNFIVFDVEFEEEVVTEHEKYTKKGTRKMFKFVAK